MKNLIILLVKSKLKQIVNIKFGSWLVIHIFVSIVIKS